MNNLRRAIDRLPIGKKLVFNAKLRPAERNGHPAWSER